MAKKRGKKNGAFKQVGALFSTKKRGMLVGTIRDNDDYPNFTDLKELLDEAEAEIGITLFAHRNEDSGERGPKYRLSATIAEEYDGPKRGKKKKSSSEDDEDSEDEEDY